MAATNAGFSPGIFVGLRLGDNVAHALGGPVDAAVTGVVTEASVGITQWLVLRRQVFGAGWWVSATAVGWAVGVAVGQLGIDAVAEGIGALFRFTVIGAVGGASVGIAQWLVLRAQVARSGWWVVARTVDWGVFVPGVISGAALVCLLRATGSKERGWQT